MKHKIEIVETFRRIVEVEAPDADSAWEIVNDRMMDCDFPNVWEDNEHDYEYNFEIYNI